MLNEQGGRILHTLNGYCVIRVVRRLVNFNRRRKIGASGHEYQTRVPNDCKVFADEWIQTKRK